MLLPAASQVPGVPYANVRALEVPPEDPNKALPVMDLCWQKVLEPSSGRVRQKEGDVTNDEVIIVHSPKLTGNSIVSKP
jgi:hypothetical protein